MEYIKFSLFFILAHGLSYIIAGVIALQISKDIYKNKNRHCDFLRDMADESEKQHVSKLFLPAQIIRGLLMAVVLFPFIRDIYALSSVLQFVFFSSLMFIYTHFAAVSPFIDNIEGFVYFKKEYIKKNFFLKFQLEMIIYSILFGILMTYLMNFI